MDKQIVIKINKPAYLRERYKIRDSLLENSSIDVNTAATTLLVSALMALGYYLVTEEPNIVGAAPVDFPNQPGSPLGRGIPLGRSLEEGLEGRGPSQTPPTPLQNPTIFFWGLIHFKYEYALFRWE